MRLQFVPFLLLLSLQVFAQQYSISSPERWVNPIDYSPDNIIDDNGGHQYLLVDYQDNLKLQKVFRHYAVKLLNSDGVNDFSTLDFGFDPSYQKIYFHSLNIIRNGQVINKLATHKPIVLQRESNMERALYNGSLSVIFNLEDVRENDILEYSFSIEGFNPLKKGRTMHEYYLQYTQKVNRMYLRVITENSSEFSYRLFEDAKEPETITTGKTVEYIWDESDREAIQYDNNVPSWYSSGERIAYSTYTDWKQVCEMLLPQYSFSPAETKNLRIPPEHILPEIDTIVSLIRFVQDKVRYLGMEQGISAYRPHSPKKVYSQRFGDCKDKSLLLVTLMRNEGIEAYPLLVNTVKKQEMANALPGFNAFDHCIVCYIINNKRYFIDPTVQSQGGSYENIYLPDYSYGLLIKEGEKELISIPPTETNSCLDIHEIIQVDSLGGGALFTVKSDYKGAKADNFRSYFESASREDIEDDYLDYYSNLYYGIELDKNMEIHDENRNGSNHIEVSEYYFIRDLWLDNIDSTLKYIEVYPLVLESEMDHPNSPARTMPYFLDFPHSFSQLTEIRMYEPWPVKDEEIEIKGDGFSYINSISGEDDIIKIYHKYDISKEYVEASSVTDLLKKHERIQDELTYYISMNHSLEDFSFSTLALLFGICILVLAIFLAIKLYRNFDPAGYPLAKNLPLGSWMILPLLGLSISPIIQIIGLINSGYLDKNTWLSWLENGGNTSTIMFALLGFEYVVSIAFIVFTVQLLFSFYNRRTSLPKTIIIYYIAILIYGIIDYGVCFSVVPEFYTESDKTEAIKEIVKSVFTVAIWVPYFNFSQRVKDTFCIRREHSRA